MILINTPRKALNKAYLKVKHTRSEVDKFKANLLTLLNQINHAETEEFNKNVLADFLKNTFYSPNYFINTKGRNDLVIHNGKTANDSVGVIIEAKRANNVAEMIKKDNINVKALQELVLYYLRERITNKNLEVRNLIVTNVNEWYVFDSNIFEKLFAKNKKIVQQFLDFESGKLSGVTTDFFYKEIAQPSIQQVIEDIEYTYFSVDEINTALRNSDKGDDTKLIPFLKLLSPEHLLKISFANDSNTLNKSFYSELLHIIGLEEIKDGGKKIIARKKEGERYSGTLIENSITQVQGLFRLNNLSNKRIYGSTEEEQLFNVAIDLAITWINRILFLKLLEAQLLSYNKGDKNYAFLNVNKVKDFDELNTLFFQVLAVEPNKRNSDVKEKYSKVPYLNSSLFEPALIEQEVLFISNLSDDKNIPILSTTVLKDVSGNRLKGDINAIEYLFKFLDSYDFSNDATDDIKDDNKTLISASVLGLIFEKINGYKDGSFFTPSFVTMYMCRESLRSTIVNKVNKIKGINLSSLRDIYNSDLDANELNLIINSIKVCDPAVGSGHFLVSALNEFIAVKAELGLLFDKNGRRLKGYTFELENDELIITDDEGDIFEYKPNSPESQRIQETLFNEKKAIIENCLFGVDINPNSVKICRLRLWIELLKNAYYKDNGELETLPNIDINIKCGNSLISRFNLDTDLKDALKKSKLTIPQYKSAVNSYRNSKSKEEKWAMDNLINDVKSGFQTEIFSNDKRVIDLYRFKNELNAILNQQSLFELSVKDEKIKREKIDRLKKDISKLELKIDEIRSNKIFENAFEWRFEFPEVLNDDGDFIGFDLVIGNPPYGADLADSDKKYFAENYVYQDYQLDTYLLFVERSYKLLSDSNYLSYIVPNTWLGNLKFRKIRNFVFNSTFINEIAIYKKAVFEEAVVDTIAITLNKSLIPNNNVLIRNYTDSQTYTSFNLSQKIWIDANGDTVNLMLDENSARIKSLIEINSVLLSDLCYLTVGMKPYQAGKGIPKQTVDDVKGRVFDADYQVDSTYKKLLRGSDIHQYANNWDGNRWIKYGEFLAEPRLSANFDANEKIVVRQTGDTLIATLDTQQFVGMNNLHIITSNNTSNLSLKYLLALINSKLLDFYHSLLNPEKGEALAEVKKENLARLPIKISDADTQAKVITLVDMLLNKEVDFVLITKQLNDLVFTIYGLSDEDTAYIKAN
jgi:hypothetical protein